MAQKKIFIVEDEEDIVELLKFNLKQEGYSVKYETSGEKAVESIIKEQPDLIILDVMIPEKDGFQICRELKASHKTSKIPIIFKRQKYWPRICIGNFNVLSSIILFFRSSMFMFFD